uniref:Uncharacterized protein n=1 Tax=Arundo donax TaxID=35708 RepID=A0A0A9HC48_ARUDO
MTTSVSFSLSTPSCWQSLTMRASPCHSCMRGFVSWRKRWRSRSL